ncbi:hypothetical protein NDU88_003363 [Pleurodeles waltl]|uniref:Secreted protein n=1 Tax=Pleurodeles waltl TaxID=8319 RepID=A0AAV7W3B2_PLEWA|nr:hypothetical protein NDU88_003363 [Pleurodeles waltl]
MRSFLMPLMKACLLPRSTALKASQRKHCEATVLGRLFPHLILEGSIFEVPGVYNVRQRLPRSSVITAGEMIRYAPWQIVRPMKRSRLCRLREYVVQTGITIVSM